MGSRGGKGVALANKIQRLPCKPSCLPTYAGLFILLVAIPLSLLPPDGRWAVSLPFSLQLLASVYAPRQFGLFF